MRRTSALDLPVEGASNGRVADPREALAQLFRDLRGSPEGLSGRGASRRLTAYGPNELRRRGGAHWPEQLAKQLTHPLPNQINNVLAFPGIFRGALDVRASGITSEMELAAAHALAEVVDADHLAADYVVPSVFDRRVAPAVAAAVARAAKQSGVARRRRTATPAGA